MKIENCFQDELREKILVKHLCELRWYKAILYQHLNNSLWSISWANVPSLIHFPNAFTFGITPSYSRLVNLKVILLTD